MTMLLAAHHARRLLELAMAGPTGPRRDRCRDDRGEGVISMAIAVLIVAFLGVGLWLAFEGFANDTERTLEDQVDQIGG